jgi:hypothetical protein
LALAVAVLAEWLEERALTELQAVVVQAVGVLLCLMDMLQAV